MKKTVLKTYFYTLLIGSAYLVFIRLTRISLPCIIYKLTGIKCPSCGTTSMFVELSKLNISQAIAYNPVMFFLVCLWVFVSLMILLEVKFFQNKKFLFFTGIVSVLLLLVLGAFRIFKYLC